MKMLEPAADAGTGEDGIVEEKRSRPQLSWPNAVTLVLAGETPEQRRWAADTAIGVAKRLGEQKPKVVLTDLIPRHRASPSETLGFESGPGIADVLMRGEPFTVAARRPGSGSFFFLTLGSDPPTAEVLFAHPRWRKIAARLPEVNAYLLPCVEVEEWEAFGPIEGFEACVVINGTGAEVALPAGAQRLAEFRAPPEVREKPRPASGAVPEAGAGSEEVATGRGEAVGRERPEEAETVAWSAEERPRSRAANVVVGLEPERGRRAGTYEAGSRGASRRRGERIWTTNTRWLIGALASTALLVAVIVWGIRREDSAEMQGPGLEAASATEETLQEDEALRAGESPAESEAAPAPADVAAPAPPPLQPVALPYSVLIASFSSLDDARTLERQLSRADTRIYVAPTPVRGVVYFRVFAGMLPERKQAVDLMAELVRSGLKETTNDWDVRPARYAFSFGSYPTSEEAMSVVDTLAAKRIPAYVLPVPGRDGVETAYRIYAGGFENEEHAGPLREIIVGAGLDAELVERVGLLTP